MLIKSLLLIMILKTIEEIEKELNKLKKDLAEVDKDIKNMQGRINILELEQKLKASSIWAPPKNIDKDNYFFDMYQ